MQNALIIGGCLRRTPASDKSSVLKYSWRRRSASYYFPGAEMKILAKHGAPGWFPDRSRTFSKTRAPLKDHRPKDASLLGFSQLQGNRVSLFDPRLPLLPLQTKDTAIYTPPLELRAATQLRVPRVSQRRLQTGKSVDALRAFFPKMLRETWPQELLSDEVVFLDNIAPQFGLLSFNSYGKREYNGLMWFLRFYAALLCKQSKVRTPRCVKRLMCDVLD